MIKQKHYCANSCTKHIPIISRLRLCNNVVYYVYLFSESQTTNSIEKFSFFLYSMADQIKCILKSNYLEAIHTPFIPNIIRKKIKKKVLLFFEVPLRFRPQKRTKLLMTGVLRIVTSFLSGRAGLEVFLMVL